MRGGPGSPIASSPAGTRTGSCRSRRSRRRSAGSVAAVPAQRGGAAQDHLVLRRDDGRLARPRARSSIARTSASHVVAGQALDAVVARPVIPDPRRRRQARHPVDERPAADRASGEHRHRAVPGREEAVVEVEPPVRVELVGRHRRLVDEAARPRGRPRSGLPGRARPRRLRRPPLSRRRTASASISIGSSGGPSSNGGRRGADLGGLRRDRPGRPGRSRSR